MTNVQNDLLKLTKYEHLATGIEGLDVNRGMTTEDFLLIGGGSGSGKSTIALFMACTMAKKGHTILFINYEVSPKRLSDSITELGFNYDFDFGTFDAGGQNRLKLISPTKGFSFDAIVKAVQLYKPKVLFIDLFNGLLSGISGFERNNVTLKYATELSFFGTKHNCAVVVTEQLVKDNKVGRPTLNDIQGSSSLVHKATRILTAYRYSSAKLEELTRKAVTGKIQNGKIMLTCSELITRKDRLGLWNSGTSYIKYERGEGFLSLEDWEQAEYFSTIFGVNGK
jgi:energy-coupling factor transporter ATP-binding protein EcfA2